MTLLTYMKRHKNRILLALGVILLATLLILSDPGEVIAAIGALTWWQLGILIGLQLLTLFLINAQWRSVAWHLGKRLRYRKLLKMNFLGTFFESVTPVVKAGGEAYKFFYLKEQGLKTGDASALIAAQKSVSFLTFTVLAMLAILTSGISAFIETSILRVAIINLTLLLLLILALFLLVRFYQKKQRNAAFQRFSSFFEALGGLKTNKRRLSVHILLGFTIWTLYAFKTYAVLEIMDIEIAFLFAAAITYITYIVNMLPLSPGGLGTFEGTMAALLFALDTPASHAMAAAMTLRLFTFWFMLFLSAGYLGIDQIRRRTYQNNKK